MARGYSTRRAKIARCDHAHLQCAASGSRPPRPKSGRTPDGYAVQGFFTERLEVPKHGRPILGS
jgi:hypothetical protein